MDCYKKTVKTFTLLVVLLLLSVNSFAKDIIKELQGDFDNHPTLKEANFKVVIKEFNHGFLTLYKPERPRRQGRITIFEAQNMNNEWDALKRKAEQLARGYSVKDVIWFKGSINTDLLGMIEKGDKALVVSLLSKGANVDASKSDGETALMLASKNGNLGIVKLLVSKKATIEAVDKNGDSALGYASYMGHDEVVRFLINSGANVFHKNKTNKTALMYARNQKHSKVIKYLEAKFDYLKKDFYGAYLYIAKETGNGALIPRTFCNVAELLRSEGNISRSNEIYAKLLNETEGIASVNDKIDILEL